MKTARQLLIDGLKAMGADGLYSITGCDETCGCGLDDLMPCGCGLDDIYGGAMSEDILERAKDLQSRLASLEEVAKDPCRLSGVYGEIHEIRQELREMVAPLAAEIERLRALENCVSLVIDRQGKTNAALLGQLDVISAYLDAELVEWKNGDQIAEIAIKFMDRQKQNLNDANSQIAAKNDKIAQDAITIQMHHNNVLTLQKEVERLRSENKIISDRAAHHEKQDAAEIELLAARIKELEAINELNHKNMRSWLDTTTDKEFLDKLSSEIGFKDAYIKRLEAAFLEATKEIVYATHEGRDAPEGEDVYAEKVAREALERIKAGGRNDNRTAK